MIKENYPYYGSKNKTRFFFESIGKQGKIIKVIEFRHLEGDKWNLGFGDWVKGKIDDIVISNNNDVNKIINTVAKVTYEFFEKYPDKTIVIAPIDDRRKQLYNFVFQRHIKEIEPIFHVTGLTGKLAEPYTNQKNYDGFEIKLKFEQ